MMRPLLISLALIGMTIFISPVHAQQTIKDMKPVFAKIPLSKAATGQKPAMVLPICASRTTAATKILMINSTLMAIGDCPNVLVGLLKSAHTNAEVKLTEVIGEDYAFRNHLLDGSAAKAIEKSGPWDYVLLQPHSKELVYKTAETIRDAQILAGMATAQHCRVLVLDTWSSNEPNDPCPYTAMEQGNRVLAQNLHCERVPISTALWEAKNIPNVRLFRTDNHHLASEGVYLAACVLYAKLTHRSPVGLPCKVLQESRIMCEVAPEIGKALQGVAAAFVK